MKNSLKWLACVVLLSAGTDLARAEEGAHRIGGGVNYWVAIDDIDTDNVDDNGFSYLASYQYRPGLLGLEVDAEFMPDRFGKDAWAPEAYLLLGKAVYAGAGIGIVNSGSDFADEPFFALKAGLDLELLPRVHLDIAANYRFNDQSDIENSTTDIDTDTIFLGAALRLAL